MAAGRNVGLRKPGLRRLFDPADDGGGDGAETRIGDTVDDPRLKVVDHDDAGLFFTEELNEIGVSLPDAKKVGGFSYNAAPVIDGGEGALIVPAGRVLTIGDLPVIDNKPSVVRLLADGSVVSLDVYYSAGVGPVWEAGPQDSPHLPGARASLSSSERLTIGAPWLALNVGDPDGPPNYITSNGEALLTEKIPVIAASVADIPDLTVVSDGGTLDGILLGTGDRVLIKNQADPVENGIYIVGATGVLPTRADDDRELQWGIVRVRPKDYHATLTPAQVAAAELPASVNNQTIWVCTEAGQEAGDPPEPTAVTFVTLAEFIGALSRTGNLSELADAEESRINLGISAVGDDLITAGSAALQRTVLGLDAGGDYDPSGNLADVAANMTSLGGALVAAADAAAARAILGAFSVAFSADIDCFAAAGTTWQVTPAQPGKFFFSGITFQMIIIAKTGTLTGSPSFKMGTNPAHDNASSPLNCPSVANLNNALVGEYAGFTITLVHGVFRPATDLSNPMVIEMVTPATGAATLTVRMMMMYSTGPVP